MSQGTVHHHVSRRSPLAWWAAIPGMVTLLVGGIALWGDRWSLLGVPVGDDRFGDLKMVLKAAVCVRLDPSWTPASAPCLPGVEIYNYPIAWARLGAWLGADPSWAPAIVIALMVAFAASLSALTWFACAGMRRWPVVIAMTVAGLLPPVVLAYERGNVDLAIFGLLVLGLYAVIAGHLVSGGVILGLITAMKLFPLGSGLVFISRAPKTRRGLVTYALVAGVGLLAVIRDLPFIARSWQIDGASFGAGLLPLLVTNRVQEAPSLNAIKLVGLALFALGIALVLVVVRWNGRARFAWANLTGPLRRDPTAEVLVLGGGGAFLVAYLVSISFDYRLIFLLPVVAGMLRLGSRAGWGAAVCLLVIMLFSYSTYIGPAEYVADLMLLIVAPAMAVLIAAIIRTRLRPAPE